MKPKIGFVGVGRMGSNMARRLKFMGYPVTAVYDAAHQIAHELAVDIGACGVLKLADVTAAADVIFTVVSDDAAMHAIFGNPEDNLFMGATGKLIINCATISPDIHMDLAKRGKKLGVDILEAPMASSITQAREGKLFMMIGGDREVFERAQPILKDMTASMKYIGKAGSASYLKALVNMVMNINTAGLAEGLGLADALGLDLKMVMEVFAQTGANSRVLETDAEDMLNREHSTFFSAAHAAKDSGIALALGKTVGISLPLAAATKRQYDHLTAIGCGNMDKSSISELTFKNRQSDKGLRD